MHLYTCLVGLERTDICAGLRGWGGGGGAVVVSGTQGRHYGPLQRELRSHSQQTHSARVLDSTSVPLCLQLGYFQARTPRAQLGSVWVGGLGSASLLFFADDAVELGETSRAAGARQRLRFRGCGLAPSGFGILDATGGVIPIEIWWVIPATVKEKASCFGLQGLKTSLSHNPKRKLYY